MFDLVWTILNAAGSLAMTLLFLILAIPLLIVLKAAGEIIGIAFSVCLAPLFHIPKQLRTASIALLTLWILWAYPPSFWLQIFLMVQLLLVLGSNFFSSNRYRSLEAYAVTLVPGAYGLYLCFLQSGRWTDTALHQFILVSLMCAAPAYFLRSLARAYTVSQKEQEQRDRDTYALRVDRRIRAGKSSPRFCLYLRGFALDNLLAPPLTNWGIDGGRFTSGKPIFPTSPSTLSDELNHIGLDGLESVLRQSSKKLGNLIALGQAGEAFGAGRLESDEASWQDTVARLMKQALVIFIIPVDTPGTLWEIEHLVSKGYLNKTVFVLPQSKLLLEGSNAKISHEVSWNAVRNKLRDVLLLPAYQNEAGFFMRGRDGQFVFTRGHWENDKGLFAVYRTRESLMSLLSQCRTPG